MKFTITAVILLLSFGAFGQITCTELSNSRGYLAPTYDYSVRINKAEWVGSDYMVTITYQEKVYSDYKINAEFKDGELNFIHKPHGIPRAANPREDFYRSTKYE